MNERSILIAQIQTLAQELGRAESALDAQEIDSDLRERVRIRFDKLIKKQQQALTNVRREVEGGQPPEACWDSFRSIRKECGPLFHECLAFMQGALVRSAGLDDGLCRIADVLLDGLSHQADIPWERFTILAEGEFFADMAEIIRLRFPELSIWNLPVTGHEFGHFVGPKLEVHGLDGKSRHPFQDLLERERRQGQQYWSFLHEHFADLFAVYALGPAFACTCILLRFDPGMAYLDGQVHPGYAKRVHFILKALEKMDEAETGVVRYYRDIIKMLGKLWRQGLAATGQPESLDQSVTIPLDGLLDELYVLVDTELPRVRYRGWLGAQMLADKMQPDKDTAPTLRDQDTLPDVLNAAWLCRIQHWDGDSHMVRRIGERAVELCRQIMRRP